MSSERTLTVTCTGFRREISDRLRCNTRLLRRLDGLRPAPGRHPPHVPYVITSCFDFRLLAMTNPILIMGRDYQEGLTIPFSTQPAASHTRRAVTALAYPHRAASPERWGSCRVALRAARAAPALSPLLGEAHPSRRISRGASVHLATSWIVRAYLRQTRTRLHRYVTGRWVSGGHRATHARPSSMLCLRASTKPPI